MSAADTTLTASTLKVKLYADGAEKAQMLDLYRNPLVKGFTTNPSLMRKAGIADYEAFARDILKDIPDRPISFEVFSDELGEMEQQARAIATWGANVYVKLPVTNTAGKPVYEMINRLSREGVKINLTAIFTDVQVQAAIMALAGGAPCNISIFAGRIADTGRDPMPMMRKWIGAMKPHRNIECIWASTREIFNVAQADEIGCHIITAPTDIIKKIGTLGKDLAESSLETVKTFRADSLAAGFTIKV